MIDPGLIIIGTSGMLGRELEAACNVRGLDPRSFPGRRALDITDADRVTDCLAELRPSVVVNATGYNDVDRAESEPDAADRSNHVGPANLARASKAVGALFVHYSTDYVFDGRAERPYRVDDAPGPLGAYGRSKLAGEQAIAETGCRHLIIRTSWLFAVRGRNFVRTILDLGRKLPEVNVVTDQVSRPTYAPDLARITLDLLERGATGTVHAANDGQCSWFELARTVAELAALDCRVQPCLTADMPRPAARPPFSVLDLSAIEPIVGRPRPWTEALAECVEQLTRVTERR